MALGDTPFGAKKAIMAVLDRSLNDGLDQQSPEYVNIFYGWKEADSPNRFIVVGDTSTDYNTEGIRLDARSTLRRYDLTYNVNVDIVSGLHLRSQEVAERQCFELYDRVLTPLVRGDGLGESAVNSELRGVRAVVPISDNFVVKPDDSGKPLYAVLRFVLGIALIRD